MTTSTQTLRPGRKPRFDRDAIVARIADLFWARGYDGVSLSDVMAETGLSKSSLYNSFGDKDDLFRISLSHYHTQVVEAGADWLALDDGADPLGKLDQLLSGPADDVFGADPDSRGCFLCNTSADGFSHTPEVNDLVGQGFDALTHGMTTLLRRAAPGAPSDALTDLAATLVTAYAGMRVRSRHAKTRPELDSVRRTLITMTRGQLALISGRQT